VRSKKNGLSGKGNFKKRMPGKGLTTNGECGREDEGGEHNEKGGPKNLKRTIGASRIEERDKITPQKTKTW